MPIGEADADGVMAYKFCGEGGEWAIVRAAAPGCGGQDSERVGFEALAKLAGLCGGRHFAQVGDGIGGG